jgi:hypothetical protein
MTGFKTNTPVKYRTEKLYKLIQKKNCLDEQFGYYIYIRFCMLRPEKDTDLLRP